MPAEKHKDYSLHTTTPLHPVYYWFLFSPDMIHAFPFTCQILCSQTQYWSNKRRPQIHSCYSPLANTNVLANPCRSCRVLKPRALSLHSYVREVWHGRSRVGEGEFTHSQRRVCKVSHPNEVKCESATLLSFVNTDLLQRSRRMKLHLSQ